MYRGLCRNVWISPLSIQGSSSQNGLPRSIWWADFLNGSNSFCQGAGQVCSGSEHFGIIEQSCRPTLLSCADTDRRYSVTYKARHLMSYVNILRKQMLELNLILNIVKPTVSKLTNTCTSDVLCTEKISTYCSDTGNSQSTFLWTSHKTNNTFEIRTYGSDGKYGC